jgi:hypothetical protein
MTNTFTKDPDAVLDYQWDWSEWLATGETIASVVITPDTGITLDSQSNTTTTVTAWLSGGTVDEGYRVVCEITTNAGRTDDRSIYLICRER